MSKIGRRPITIEKGVTVEVRGQDVSYKGPRSSGIHHIPSELTVEVQDGKITLIPSKTAKDKVNKIWGLHRALLANKLQGAARDFETKIEIVGLGFKAVASGNKLTFSIGYTDKVIFELPQNVSVDVDKTGQRVTFKSPDKELVGLVASQVKALRPPEPYKGTGIKYVDEVIFRKAGKTKASS